MTVNYYLVEIYVNENGVINSMVKDRWNNCAFKYIPIDIPCENRFHIEYE